MSDDIRKHARTLMESHQRNGCNNTAYTIGELLDHIEALEAAARPLSKWFRLHYPVKWEHGGGAKLDRALGADR